MRTSCGKQIDNCLPFVHGDNASWDWIPEFIIQGRQKNKSYSDFVWQI